MRRPDMSLFNVPRLPEKQIKKEEQVADIEGLDELQDWVDGLLQSEGGIDVDDINDGAAVNGTRMDDCTSPAPGSPGQQKHEKPNATVPNTAFMLTAFDCAMEWRSTVSSEGGKSQPLEGFRPPCVLSGRGASLADGIPTAGILGASGFAPGEAVLEISAADMTVRGVHTATFLGYSACELRGRPFVAIAHPAEHSDLVNSVQVLLRMGEIERITGWTPGKPQEMRLIHHVLLGLGRPERQPTVVTLETDLTLQAQTGIVLCRSRRHMGAEGPFQMLPVPQP